MAIGCSQLFISVTWSLLVQCIVRQKPRLACNTNFTSDHGCALLKSIKRLVWFDFKCLRYHISGVNGQICVLPEIGNALDQEFRVSLCTLVSVQSQIFWMSTLALACHAMPSSHVCHHLMSCWCRVNAGGVGNHRHANEIQT